MDLLYSQTTIEFVTLASEYCAFVTNVSKLKQKEFVEKSQKLLPLLYFKATVLPQIDKQTEGELQETVSEIEYNIVYTNTAEKLDTKDVFVDVYEPARQESSEANNLSMSECFADIYQDLKNFIDSYQTGVEEIMYEALWQCNYNFQEIWGPRVIALLNEIHNLAVAGELE